MYLQNTWGEATQTYMTSDFHIFVWITITCCCWSFKIEFIKVQTNVTNFWNKTITPMTSFIQFYLWCWLHTILIRINFVAARSASIFINWTGESRVLDVSLICGKGFSTLIFKEIAAYSKSVKGVKEIYTLSRKY